MDNDKLVIGGHEFRSRFILGSGKYSLNLIEAAIKDAGAEIITLAVRRANTKERGKYLGFYSKGSYIASGIPVAQEMQKKQSALPDLRES